MRAYGQRKGPGHGEPVCPLPWPGPVFLPSCRGNCVGAGGCKGEEKAPWGGGLDAVCMEVSVPALWELCVGCGAVVASAKRRVGIVSGFSSFVCCPGACCHVRRLQGATGFSYRLRSPCNILSHKAACDDRGVAWCPEVCGDIHGIPPGDGRHWILSCVCASAAGRRNWMKS